jgi:hypothetical protein
MNYCNSHIHVSKVGENYCLECGEKLQPETVKDSSSDDGLDSVVQRIVEAVTYRGTNDHEDVRSILKSERNRVLDEIAQKLPEEKEAKAPYSIMELEKAFQNGRSQALREVKKILEELKHG